MVMFAMVMTHVSCVIKHCVSLAVMNIGYLDPVFADTVPAPRHTHRLVLQPRAYFAEWNFVPQIEAPRVGELVFTKRLVRHTCASFP